MKLAIHGFVGNGTMSQVVNFPDNFAIKEIHEYEDDKIKTIYTVSPRVIVVDESMVVEN